MLIELSYVSNYAFFNALKMLKDRSDHLMIIKHLPGSNAWETGSRTAPLNPKKGKHTCNLSTLKAL